MCGIVGYVGKSQAVPILLDGLRRLEYRGYDSAGVAILEAGQGGGGREGGRIADLGGIIKEEPPGGAIGISHTRWAAHGGVTGANARPQAARRGSPLVLGIGKGENVFARDVSAIVSYTRDAIYLKDYDIAALTREEFEITSLLGGASGFEVTKVEMTEEDVS